MVFNSESFHGRGTDILLMNMIFDGYQFEIG